MQTGTDQLTRQQKILQVLGYYNGLIDGVWSNKTIEAKKKWEVSGKFNPGLPNNGLPLADKGPYPRGIYRDPKTGLLSCSQLEQALIEEAKKKPVESTKPATAVKEDDE